MMRHAPFSLAFLILFLPSTFRSSRAEAPPVLLDRLNHAAALTTLDGPASPPFHLKLSVEVLPQHGRAADKGTVEIWWTAENQQRVVYDLSQYHATIVHTTEGILRTPAAAASPYIVDHLIGQVLHPIPDKLSTSDFKIEATRKPFGKINLDCIQLAPSSSKSSEGKRTTFCFDDHAALRVILANPDQYNLRQTLATFGTRSVPMDLQYTFFRNLVATAHIDVLQSQKFPYSEASDTKDLVAVPTPAVSVPGQTLSGRLLRKPDPIYPQEAKDNHVSGTVLLHAIIGVDGKVKSLSLIGSPDDSLTASSMEAVNKWVYQPYLVNGVPTEVDTTITVNYAYGPP